ncbi:LL-diaminopimelate aminotransferase [Clostridium tetanomorphum]|uniref:Aminotransferase class I/II-fold pyridoxal phosphate-dependent enzyme n=1 Tax=Clostridium tetanomorphum TaxID=1553 RepID=A0A923ECZ4_CLOTT|nr:aminotransferase class I/II-fold pyridoxal phosphate-dependent enzyme [Clostridium tetanomorphum]KAJ51497.1 PLP-dependent aminotransferase [Clostridium tetanomorphum DSM 665]MBC2398849.1 aminotransferase class I/II-fold pyridoxal phosphate-dependent enzyme [Clostridium tetanomorphum]MBP1865145.1 LL-diaminopimelate aminotransferase [Clostridium tetanomorphum]NRS84716.1 LL-diaminopimelate aminotransferase [Clostridium tetanomorphum]NRZ97931.1 LL-diaminopimelate aminotransferase [Clostridium t
MKINNRLNNIPEFELGKTNKIKTEIIKDKKDIINLTVGDPELPVDKSILEGMIESFYKKGFNNYPPYDGIIELKHGIIDYYKDIFGVKLKEDEVLILIGSKEGISNLIPAVCDLGEYVIIPKPSYPVYEGSSKLWGVVPYKLTLKEKDGYLPDIKLIPKEIVLKSKLFIINYPNNPTGAIANKDFYKDIVEFCYKNNIVLCNDGAYNEIIRTKDNPLSLLQFDYEKKCIEFGTFSKIYNMTGFRIAYAVGNSEVLKAMLKIKMNMDSGQFIPIQMAALNAIKLGREYINSTREVYIERINIAENLLRKHNISFFKNEGTFYIWCKVPKDYTTDEFCDELLKKSGIMVTPGYIFGNLFYGYFRIALTKDKSVIENALNKLNIY